MSQSSSRSAFEYEHDTPDPNKSLWLIVAVIVAIVAAFIFLRTTPTDLGSNGELTAILNNGQPKVLEFYSNF